MTAREEVELDDESTDETSDGSSEPVSTSTLTALPDTVGGGGFGGLSLRGVGLQATGTEDGGDGAGQDAGSDGTTTDSGPGTTANGTTTDADGSGDNSTSTDSSVDESTCEGDGDRVILRLQKLSLRSEKAIIRESQKAAKIDERLARLADKPEASGKTNLLAKLTAKAEERKARDQERLERTLVRVDEKTKAAIDRATNRRKKQTDDGGSDKGKNK